MYSKHKNMLFRFSTVLTFGVLIATSCTSFGPEPVYAPTIPASSLKTGSLESTSPSKNEDAGGQYPAEQPASQDTQEALSEAKETSPSFEFSGSEPISQPVFDGDFDDVVMAAPTLEELEELHKSFTRYSRNIVATGRIFAANVSNREEQIIDYILKQDPNTRSKQERALLTMALLEHAVVEYDHLMQAEQTADIRLMQQNLWNRLISEYKIDIAHEVYHNDYLADPTVYHMAFVVLVYVNASETILRKLIRSLKPSATKWASLHRVLENYERGDNSENGLRASVPIESPQKTHSPTTGVSQGPVTPAYSAGVFAEGDKTIREAKEWYAKGNYQHAVKILEKIPQSSPHFGTARSLAANYSDTAVNALRKESALLFQNHVRVNSVQTKITYLKQAEAKLQDAIASYPESRWLEKVRENLRVIQARLEDLEILYLSKQR